MKSAHPLAALAKRRDRVAAAITGTVGPRGFDPARAAEAALALLPPGVDYSAVYRSLLSLGSTPTPTIIREVAWAVAGDIKTLRAKLPVYPTLLPVSATSVTVQFLASTRVPSRRNEDESKTRYRIRIVQGRATPLIVEVVWPDRLVRYRATHPTGLGFARPPRGERPAKPGAVPYQHPDTLVGMLAKADLSTDPKDGKPKFDNLRGTSAIRTYNQTLTNMRLRNGFVCPFGFQLPAHPCHRCPKGQTSCPAAVRPADLVPTACPVCCNPDAVTDPSWSGVVCTTCVTRKFSSTRSITRELK